REETERSRLEAPGSGGSQGPEGAGMIVMAPEPIVPPCAAWPANRVLSVAVEAEQEIRWIWTTTHDGASYVSGYTIVETGKRRMPTGSPSAPNS
ncbi:MAG TPA: hypothetical protein VIV54_04415, partial [Burkholderiales bacterium]